MASLAGQCEGLAEMGGASPGATGLPSGLPWADPGPTLGPALALRGRLALERGKLSKAHDDAGEAIKLSPKQALGYYVRGRVRLERGRPDGLADLARAAELSARKDALILHWLAAALSQAGRYAEALTTQREAVQLRPQDPELLEQLQELERVVARAQVERRGG